jgi:hypothetical protein
VEKANGFCLSAERIRQLMAWLAHVGGKTVGGGWLGTVGAAIGGILW